MPFQHTQPGIIEPRLQLTGQAALAHATFAHQQDHATLLLVSQPVDHFQRLLELVFAADHWRTQPFEAAHRARPLFRANYPVRVDRARDVFQRQRGQMIKVKQAAGLAVDALADQNLARPGRFLQAPREVDRVADGRVIHQPIAAQPADDHRASVQPQVDLQLVAVQVQLLAQTRYIRQHIQRRTQGAFRVVFVGNRRAKQGHQPVAGQLIDHALVFVDIIDQHADELLHQLVEFFVAQHLREVRVPGEVYEQYGHAAALSPGL